MVYSHNFVDFGSFGEPMKRGISIQRFYQLTHFNKEYFFKVPLIVHDVDFQDNLINPLSAPEGSLQFVSTDSVSAFDS